MIEFRRRYFSPFGCGDASDGNLNADRTVYFEVNCPVNTSLLRTIRCFVTRVADEMGFDEERISQIEMAVDEACSNVAIHAYDDEGICGDIESDLELKLEMDEHSLTIYVRDKGRVEAPDHFSGARSFEEYQNQGFNDNRYHGLGILIMKKFMDEVEFVRGPERGTLVKMKKYLQP